MNPHQLSALSDSPNSTRLAATLEPILNLFLDYLQSVGRLSPSERCNVQSNTSPKGQLYLLLNILQNKDAGWDTLIRYLEENGYDNLADQLQKSADKAEVRSCSIPQTSTAPIWFLVSANESTCATVSALPTEIILCSTRNPPESKFPPISLLQEFTLCLADFYLRHYVQLRILGEHHIHIKDVWVPLKVAEKTQSSRQCNQFDHDTLLERLVTDMSAHVALIRADPGMGKTTLLMKIVYDWAMKRLEKEPRCSEILQFLYKIRCYGNFLDVSEKFSLILAVPLREAGNADNFLHLAVDYFIQRFIKKPFDRDTLITQIDQLNSKLLLCFDGLDEYRNFDESPFRSLFKTPLKQSRISTTTPSLVPDITYKLIVTSRPYACQHGNLNFFPLTFEICPLNDASLSTFVSRYCHTETGPQRALAFLQNCGEVVKVPLVFTFVCHLADAIQEIPTNMTFLYDSFLREMWLRKKQAFHLAENDADVDQWRNSNVVMTTASLAFWGCQREQFLFEHRMLQEFEVSIDSFICGFVLYKYDFARPSQMAEFLHPSVQEFFAALHCHNLINLKQNIDSRWVIRQICNEYSQFGRFLLGISSQSGDLPEVLESLHPSTNNFGLYDIIGSKQIIYRLSDCLCDCSEEETREGTQWLRDLISQMNNDISDSRRPDVLNIILPQTENPCLSPVFQEEIMELECQPKSSTVCGWIICKEPRTAMVAWITDQPSTGLLSNFDKIKYVFWLLDVDDSIQARFRAIPPAMSVVVRTKEWCQKEVNFQLFYGNSSPGELQFFSFGSENGQFTNGHLFTCLTSPTFLTIVDETRTEKIVWLAVQVSGDVDQETMLYELTKLAVMIFKPMKPLSSHDTISASYYDYYEPDSTEMHNSSIHYGIPPSRNFRNDYPGLNVLANVHNPCFHSRELPEIPLQNNSFHMTQNDESSIPDRGNWVSQFPNDRTVSNLTEYHNDNTYDPIITLSQIQPSNPRWLKKSQCILI